MIKVSQVSKVYDKRGIAGLHGISFEIKEGQIAALMGPNGSGKTSLLNIIQEKLPQESGKIEKDGSIVAFDASHFPTTGNVQKFLVSSVTVTESEEKKIQLVRDLADVLEFTFQLRQDLNDLSAGQKQKVLLAAVLINRPSTLLLDEPFTHLDPMTRKGILQALFTYIKNQNISLLWVTHDLEEACQFSDVLGILHFGKLEQWGKPQDIVFQPRNLFVAEFVGYKNILAIKHNEGSWQTPWGSWTYPHHEHIVEALLVIPQSSWQPDPDKRVGFHFKTSRVAHGRWYVEAEGTERIFAIELSSTEYDKLKDQSVFYFKPKWEDCFLIPL